MTIARWIIRGRAVLLALLVLCVPASASADAAPALPHAERLVLREDHRRLALKPAREALARKRAARRRAAAAAAAPSSAPAGAAPASRAATKPERDAKPKRDSKPKGDPKPKRDAKPKGDAKAKGEGRPAPKAPPLSSDYGEGKPLDLPTNVQVGQARADGGGSLGRTLFGLLIVVALIYGLTLVLRRMRNGSLGGGGRSQGLKAVASIPLGPNRSIHLVRAGHEYLLVGAAEHGVVPLRTYSEDEARAAGLLDLDGGATQQAVRRVVTRERGAKVDPSTFLDNLRSRTVRH